VLGFGDFHSDEGGGAGECAQWCLAETEGKRRGMEGGTGATAEGLGDECLGGGGVQHRGSGVAAGQRVAQPQRRAR
jgi:hypothetical protein